MTLRSVGRNRFLAGLSPEMQALLRTVQVAVHGRAADNAPLGPIDLPTVLALARRHRLLPVFECHAAQAGFPIPKAARPDLELETARIAARNLLLSSTLLEVMDALCARGIRAAAYKGPAVAVWAYGDLGLRTFEDLDVLVPRSDLTLAAGTLRELGFRLKRARGDSDRVLAIPTEYHYPYCRMRDGVVVELHSRLAPYYFLGGAGARLPLLRAVPVSLGFGSVSALSPEDLILALCFHGAKHAWQWLSMVADVALLTTRRPEIDWEMLWRRAGKLGARRMVLCSFALAECAFATPVPVQLAEASKHDAEVLPVISRAIAGWQSNAFEPAATTIPRFHLRCFERRRDQYRYAILLILAPNWDDIEWLLLPRGLNLLYWLLRPLRLLCRRLPPLLRSLLGRFASSPVR